MNIFLSQLQQTGCYGEIEIFVIFKLLIYNFFLQISQQCMIQSRDLGIVSKYTSEFQTLLAQLNNLLLCNIYNSILLLSNQLNNVRIVQWLQYQFHQIPRYYNNINTISPLKNIITTLSSWYFVWGVLTVWVRYQFHHLYCRPLFHHHHRHHHGVRNKII